MTNSPPPLDTITPEATADGSYTFYSETFGEWFHSRHGAYQEAFETYVEPTQLPQKAQRESLTLLDVCYGLGYNTAAALETIWRINPHCRVTVVGLELNLDVPQAAIAHQFTHIWSSPIQAILAELAQAQVISTERLQARLLIGDARQQIQPLVAQGFQADAVFFDPFSPPRCPMLWSVDFFQQVRQCLKPDGRLATYSCAAAVRAGLQEAGLRIGAIAAAGRQWPGTIAVLDDDGNTEDLPPLSQREIEHLQTKAAVPYRDRALNATAQEIMHERQQEQAQSSLLPTSQWRKRWLNSVTS